MNYLKKFESFQTNDEIHKICQEYKIKNYTINEDDSIDVNGNVDLSLYGLKNIPLKFNHVSGYFNCCDNRLTTLEGAPQSVDGYFSCFNNYLTTLKGGPQSVGDYFTCFNNKLTTLKYGPHSVNGRFNCSYNSLTTLEGAPNSIYGEFNCFNNQLTTLSGSPNSVDGDFICSNNKLTTLKGAPQSVSGYFNCSNNDSLKALYYLPKHIGSEEVIFINTDVYEIFKILNNFSLGAIRYVNDLKVIVDDKIDLEILNDLLYDQGKPLVDKVFEYDNI